MTDDSTDITERQRHVQRLEKLAAERRAIMALDAKQALDAIIEHPQARALVHSFAEEDLHFLIHDIGPEDSLDLIAMASDRQWDYIFDIESWTKDRIDLPAVTQWMALMMKADPRRFIRWAITERPNLVEYFLFHAIEVVVREHDQDPSDFGDGFNTYDDVYYFRIPENNYAQDVEPDFKALHQEVLEQITGLIAEMDHVFFQQTLLRSASVIPAESEEEAFRLRNFRLAEKGFLPFHEAVGVFQPMRVAQLKKRKKILQKSPTSDTWVPAPLNHTALLTENSLFTQALSKIDDVHVLQQLNMEFAGVCNQLTAAEQKPVRGREALKAIVKKACAYTSIGLESLLDSSKTSPDRREEHAAAGVTAHPLIDLFRTGYGHIAALREQSKTWRTNNWATKNNLPMSFWGERMVGVIGGLLIRQPLFYDNYKRGALYREFETMADIDKTRSVLDEAIAWDGLLRAMDLPAARLTENTFITCENLLMTLWARHCLNLPPEITPIGVKTFMPFFADLWETEKIPLEIKEVKKTDFLKWLAAESRLPQENISKDLGLALEILFDNIAKDSATVQAEDLDPRFVTAFMLYAE